MKAINKSTKIIVGTLLAAVALSSVAGERQLVKKPGRAVDKPDLVISYVNSYYPETNKIKVTVRNNGKVKSGSSVLRVSVGGMTSEVSIPALNPYYAAEPEVVFNKPLVKGQKMRVFVDSKRHVAESNENNNTKTHTY